MNRLKSIRPGRAVAIVLVTAAVALLAYGLTTVSPDGTIRGGLNDGSAVPAPGFELELLDTEADSAGLIRPGQDSLALSDLRGTPVVLNFWASWCGPCREEAPVLASGWRRDRNSGVLYLGVDTQDASEDAKAFTDEFAITYPSVRDPERELGNEYGLTGIPETYFIDADGRVVGGKIGVVDASTLEAGVEAAIRGEVVGLLGDPNVDPGLSLEPRTGDETGNPASPYRVAATGPMNSGAADSERSGSAAGSGCRSASHGGCGGVPPSRAEASRRRGRSPLPPGPRYPV